MLIPRVYRWETSYGCGISFPVPGLDFLPQLNSVFPLRKNAGSSSTLVLHSSPFNVLMGTGKEEHESHELSAESRKAHLGKPEPKDSLKQVSTQKEYPNLKFITQKGVAGICVLIISAVYLLGRNIGLNLDASF